MNSTIENIYLLLAFFFLITLCVNLTIQVLNIYQIENCLRNYLLSENQKYDNESLVYTISHLLLKKYQLIEAIQILQLTLKQKQLYDDSNKYSLSNLSNAIGCFYRKTYRYVAASYYFHLALSHNSRHVQATNNLSWIYEKKISRDSRI